MYEYRDLHGFARRRAILLDCSVYHYLTFPHSFIRLTTADEAESKPRISIYINRNPWSKQLDTDELFTCLSEPTFTRKIYLYHII